MMVVLMVVGNFTGCTRTIREQQETVSDDKEGTETLYPITVTDQLGRAVEIKQEPKRIISAYYITSSLLIALGAEERVVGIEMKADTREIYQLAAPTFLDLPAVGNSKNLNIEECLKSDPDLIIIPTRLQGFIPQLELMDIPVLAVEPENMEEFLACVELVGKATGKEARAKELIQYHQRVREQVTNLTKDIKERPSVYLAGSGDPLKTCTAQMYQHSLIEIAGGTNVSADLKEDYWMTISPEALLSWNPSKIYAVSYAGYDLSRFTEDQKYQTIDAVNNEEVYSFPSSVEPWDYPTPSSALGMLWLVNSLHPELYSQEDYMKEAVGFYEYFYDIEVDETALGI